MIAAIHDWGVRVQRMRLDLEPETAKVEECLFQRELADDQCLDDKPRSAINRDWMYPCRCRLSIFVRGKNRGWVDRNMEVVKGRDECVCDILDSLLCYAGGCVSFAVPSVLGLLTPSLLRLLLRWDGGDHK